MKEKPLLNRSGWQGDRRRYTIPFLQGRGRFPPGTYSFTGQASTNGKQRRGGGGGRQRSPLPYGASLYFLNYDAGPTILASRSPPSLTPPNGRHPTATPPALAGYMPGARCISKAEPGDLSRRVSLSHIKGEPAPGCNHKRFL